MTGYTEAVFTALVEAIVPETTEFEAIRREELPDASDLTLAEYVIESLEPDPRWLESDPEPSPGAGVLDALRAWNRPRDNGGTRWWGPR